MSSLELLSPSMDTDFMLDELQSDLVFGEIKAFVDKFLDESGNETLAETDHLDVAIPTPFEDARGDIQSPGSVAVAAPPPSRKKRLSSTQRQKREKELLLERINELQLQLKSFTDVPSKKSRAYMQKHRALDEWCDKETAIHENKQFRRAIDLKQDYIDKLSLLLQQLRQPMKVLTYSEACPDRPNDALPDATIFDMLQRNISKNYARLMQEWRHGCIPVAVEEAMDAIVSPDGNSMTYKTVRFMPFDVETVTDTAWRSGKTDFIGGTTRSTFHYGPDMFCAKEELTIHPAGQDDFRVCIRIAIRRFVGDHASVFLWETVAEWATASCSERTTTQESGWALIRPVDEADQVSVIQSLMTMSLSETSKVWMQLMHSSGVMLRVILPSYQQIMLGRLQRFENRLLDEAIHPYR